MKKVNMDSAEYKSMIRLFVSERDGRTFSYKNFVAWTTNKECLIVSHCGNSSMGQAIFASILKHEYELWTTYHYTIDGQLETLYQVEDVKKKVLLKCSIPPNLIKSQAGDSSTIGGYAIDISLRNCEKDYSG